MVRVILNIDKPIEFPYDQICLRFVTLSYHPLCSPGWRPLRRTVLEEFQVDVLARGRPPQLKGILARQCSRILNIR